MKSNLRKSLMKAYIKWAKKYITLYMKNEKKYISNFGGHYLYSLLEFCLYYIDMQYRRGRTFKFIKDFLVLQVPDIDRRNYMITFEGGLYGTIHTFVNQLCDMDFLSAKCTDNYRKITIINKKLSRWDTREAENITEMVRKTFEDDGNTLRIDTQINKYAITLIPYVNEKKKLHCAKNLKVKKADC